MNPVVTVLMPVYNAEKHLGEAMESILKQTLPNFEFLIIDDGSTDSSAEIVKSYNDSRIRFIRNEKNLGITATLNKGIQLASCEFIARMDADDISYPGRLEKQYNYFQQHPDCVLLSNAVRYVWQNRNKSRNIYFENDFIYYDLIYSCKINHPVVMYRKTVLQNEGGYQTKYAEDFNLWWRLSRKYTFFHDNEILLDYRYSETSLWKVSKRGEYDNAEFEQITSNIRHYTDDKVQFTYDEVDFLRKDLKLLIEKNGISFIKNCFRKLDQLNNYVFEKEKNGSRWKSVERAAMEKKRERLRNLQKYVSRKMVLALLMELGYWQLLAETLTNPVLQRLKNPTKNR